MIPAEKKIHFLFMHEKVEQITCDGGIVLESAIRDENEMRNKFAAHVEGGRIRHDSKTTLSDPHGTDYWKVSIVLDTALPDKRVYRKDTKLWDFYPQHASVTHTIYLKDQNEKFLVDSSITASLTRVLTTLKSKNFKKFKTEEVELSGCQITKVSKDRPGLADVYEFDELIKMIENELHDDRFRKSFKSLNYLEDSKN